MFLKVVKELFPEKIRLPLSLLTRNITRAVIEKIPLLR